MSSPFSLNGSKILITGASSGIGRAAAKLAAQAGARCIINGRDEARLNSTLCELAGGGHHAIALPLARGRGGELVRKAVELTGPINGFVHCAGIEKTLPFRQTEFADLEEIMSVNLYAFWEITQELVKRKNHEAQKLSVVALSSVIGQFGAAGETAYSASKGALLSLVKSLASEYASQKIRFNCICPGYIKTPMLDAAKRLYKSEEDFCSAIVKKHALGIGSPDDVASAAVYLLSDAAKWVTGTVLNVDGGYLK